MEYLALQPEDQKHLIRSVESMKLLELSVTAMTVSSIPCPYNPQGLNHLENTLLESHHDPLPGIISFQLQMKYLHVSIEPVKIKT